MPYSWDFAVVFRGFDLLMAGLFGSFELLGACLAIAVPLGLLLAVARMSRLRPVSVLALLYINAFRTTATLVLVFWFFYAFPILIAVRMDAFQGASLAIGLQGAAYFAEVFRGGVEAVPHGQWEACRSIGMRYVQAMRYVVLPQAVRRMIPVFFTRVIEMFKTTSLASTIAFAELSYNASLLASNTYRPIETYTVVGAMYFVIIFITSQVVRRLERRYLVLD